MIMYIQDSAKLKFNPYKHKKSWNYTLERVPEAYLNICILVIYINTYTYFIYIFIKHFSDREWAVYELGLRVSSPAETNFRWDMEVIWDLRTDILVHKTATIFWIIRKRLVQAFNRYTDTTKTPHFSLRN